MRHQKEKVKLFWYEIQLLIHKAHLALHVVHVFRDSYTSSPIIQKKR